MGYFLLLIYTALVYIRPHEIYYEMYQETYHLDAPFPILSIFALLIALSIAVTKTVNKRSFYLSLQCKLLLCLFAALLLSQLDQLRIGDARRTVNIFWGILALYFFITCLLDTPKQIKGFVILLMILTFFLVGQGIEQYNTGTAWGGHKGLMHHGELRIRWIGIFDDPNDLAIIFVIMVPFILFFLASERPLKQKGAAYVVLALILYGIFLTKSRGGFMALTAIFYLFFAMRYSGMKFALMGGLGICALFFLLPARLTDSLSGGSFIDFGRVDSWSTGLQMLKYSPVFGVGQGRFGEFHYQEAHNSYIEILAETGLFGTFFWIALFYVTLRDAYRINHLKGLGQLEDPHRLMDTIGTPLFLAIIGFLIGVFFLSRAYNFVPYMLIAIWVAMVSILQRDNPHLDLGFVKKDFYRIACLIVGIVIFMQMSVGFLWSSR